MEHVLLSSVTGEAALAGQGTERALVEPRSLTKAPSASVWYFAMSVFFVLNHLIICVFIVSLRGF